MARRGKRATEWSNLVSKTFRAGRAKNKEYSLKDAMKEASRIRGGGGSTCRGGNAEAAPAAPLPDAAASEKPAESTASAAPKSDETATAPATAPVTAPATADVKNEDDTKSEPPATTGGRRHRRRHNKKRRGGGSGTKRYSAKRRASSRTRTSRNAWY